MASCPWRHGTSLTGRACGSAATGWGLESISLTGGRLTFQGVDVPKTVAFDLKSRLSAVNFPKSRKLSVPYKAGAGSGTGVGRGLDANDPAGPVAAALKVLEQLGPSGDDD